MTTYISMLRGINVSGKKLVKMDALRMMYENLSFLNVRTYVQSDNVVFIYKDTDVGELEDIIGAEIERCFGFVVPVIVLKKDVLQAIINQNPFANDLSKDELYLHVTFLSNKPKEYDKSIFEKGKQSGEEFYFTDIAVYLYLPNGYGRTKLTNSLFENKLKVMATTRNWKTTKELLKLAAQ